MGLCEVLYRIGFSGPLSKPLPFPTSIPLQGVGGKYQAPALPYDYSGEPFSVRRKDFYPLHLARKLITNFIPTLSHESDGLILQVWSVGCVAQG